MAPHQVKLAELLQKDTGSNNGWKSYFAESESAVEKTVGGSNDWQNYPTTSTRNRKRGAPFHPAEFWRFVDRRGPDDCWPWIDTVLARTGYGMFWHAGLKQTLPAHRVAWLLTHGPIPKGLELIHVCDQPICQN